MNAPPTKQPDSSHTQSSKDSFVWPDMMNSSIKQLCKNQGRFIKGSKACVLFTQGEAANHFYLVLQGAVKLTKSLDEKRSKQQSLVDIVGPGDVIALPLMFEKQTAKYPVTAKPLGNSAILELPKKFFLEVWSLDPDLMANTIQLMQQKMNRLQGDRCLQRLPLEQKVAYVLTEKIAGNQKLRITRQDIADCIGATQESVIRILSAWSKMKWLSTKNQEIEIHELEKIRSIWKV